MYMIKTFFLFTCTFYIFQNKTENDIVKLIWFSANSLLGSCIYHHPKGCVKQNGKCFDSVFIQLFFQLLSVYGLSRGKQKARFILICNERFLWFLSFSLYIFSVSFVTQSYARVFFICQIAFKTSHLIKQSHEVLLFAHNNNSVVISHD